MLFEQMSFIQFCSVWLCDVTYDFIEVSLSCQIVSGFIFADIDIYSALSIYYLCLPLKDEAVKPES